MTAIVGGEVQASISSLVPAVPHVKSGRIRAIAVTTQKRSRAVPDVPTVAETVPGYEWITHQIVATHANTPPHLIKRLNEVVVRAINGAEMKGKAMKFGAEVRSSSPEEVTKMMKTQMTQMAKVLRASGVSAQ